MQVKFTGACFNSFGFCLKPVHTIFCVCESEKDQKNDLSFANSIYISKIADLKMNLYFC